MVKLIASDLDGTLLGPGAELHERTLAALELAQRAGVHVVAATGRAWRSAQVVLAPTDVIRHAVCSNGALEYDRVDDAVVRIDTVERGALAEAASAVLSALGGAGLGWELADGTFGWDDNFLDQNPMLKESRGHERMQPLPCDDPPAEVLKLMVSCLDLGEEDLFQKLEPVLPATVEATASGISFVEITGQGVHKAKALQALCEDLGISAADVVAFGDNRNDMAMLQWAGTGYAMANANPALTDIADAEAPHHAEQGVAQIIESLLS